MRHSLRLPHGREMRNGVAVVVFACLAGGAAAADDRAAAPGCLSQAEMREVLAQKAVIAPLVAVRAARAKSGGKVIRASLCRNDNEFVYQITTLRRDGRVVRVTVDGRSGRIEASR